MAAFTSFRFAAAIEVELCLPDIDGQPQRPPIDQVVELERLGIWHVEGQPKSGRRTIELQASEDSDVPHKYPVSNKHPDAIGPGCKCRSLKVLSKPLADRRYLEDEEVSDGEDAIAIAFLRQEPIQPFEELVFEANNAVSRQV